MNTRALIWVIYAGIDAIAALWLVTSPHLSNPIAWVVYAVLSAVAAIILSGATREMKA